VKKNLPQYSHCRNSDLLVKFFSQVPHLFEAHWDTDLSLGTEGRLLSWSPIMLVSGVSTRSLGVGGFLTLLTHFTNSPSLMHTQGHNRQFRDESQALSCVQNDVIWRKHARKHLSKKRTAILARKTTLLQQWRGLLRRFSGMRKIKCVCVNYFSKDDFRKIIWSNRTNWQPCFV
jgi:hypothetical protein